MKIIMVLKVFQMRFHLLSNMLVLISVAPGDGIVDVHDGDANDYVSEMN